MTDTERVDLSALVVNYNTAQHALEMIESLREQAPTAPCGRPLRLEFVFVDNASPKQLETELAKIREYAASPDLPGQVIMNDHNAGYAGGMNLAFEHARGDYVLVLNPDLVFLPDCITLLYAHLVQNPAVGAVGPAGYWDRGLEVMLPPNILPTLWDLYFCTLAHVFPSVNRRYKEARLHEALRVYESTTAVSLDMLSGACVLLSRQTIAKIGGLFDANFPLYYEDTDQFRRIKASGYRLETVKQAKIVHFYNRSGTTNPDEAMRRYWDAKRYYYGKYYGWVGRLSERLCRKFLKSPYAARARDQLAGQVIDLGDVWDAPTLAFGRHCESYLVELCQDAGFLLAAGVPGSGASWTPGPSFWAAFGQSIYYLRVIDLSGSKPEEIQVFRFCRVAPPQDRGPESESEPAQEPERVAVES